MLEGGHDRHLRQVRSRYVSAIGRMAEAGLHFPGETRVTQRAGISIAPGPIFSATWKYQNSIRLNCACEWDERIGRALVTLGRLIGLGQEGMREPLVLTGTDKAGYRNWREKY
jgi:hypothetical protein